MISTANPRSRNPAITSSTARVSAGPRAAALWASASRLGRGVPRQPATSACTHRAPSRTRRRRTQPVARAAASATVVSTCCIVSATCARLVIGALLGAIAGSNTPIIPEPRPARQPLILMPMGRCLLRPYI